MTGRKAPHRPRFGSKCPWAIAAALCGLATACAARPTPPPEWPQVGMLVRVPPTAVPVGHIVVVSTSGVEDALGRFRAEVTKRGGRFGIITEVATGFESHNTTAAPTSATIGGGVAGTALSSVPSFVTRIEGNAFKD